MKKETLQQKKSELELKYEAALETIAGGSSWETVIANSVLNKKRRPIRRVLAFLGDNLAAITSLVVAASGIAFGILQYKTGESQKERETKIAKVEALQKLIPVLTNENPNVRRYALSALLTLYSSSDDSSSSDNKELLSLAENISEVGDAETLEALARKLNDVKLKKKAAELYAIRAEHNRRESEAADKQQNVDKVRQYLNAAWDDTQRALSLDPENAKAMYQFGRLLMEYRGDRNGASEKFSQVIKLIDENKYPRDNEIYLRSFLNKTLCLYLPEEKITAAVCDTYKATKSKYKDANWELDIAGEKLEKLEQGCS